MVEVDDRVVSTLRAQPKEGFAARFTQDTQPALLNIAIGDTISVLIWESAAGGLFTEAPPALAPSGGRTGIEPLAPESPRQEPGAPAPPGQQRRAGGLLGAMLPSEAAGRQAVQIPDQLVESDGAISVPYAGRIPAAGRLPTEVQQTIEARLTGRALQPQALVIVKKSFANAVTVTGEVIAGGRIPLSPGGDKLREVIAAAGGAKASVHETFVRLSRDGITATIPLQQLVSDPAENVYARPGDVLSLIRVPQTFSVFGATGRNAEIPFSAAKISLSEALGKSQGLRDDLAKPEGVFLFRYEPNSVVRALDQPTAGERGRGLADCLSVQFEGCQFLSADRCIPDARQGRPLRRRCPGSADLQILHSSEPGHGTDRRRPRDVLLRQLLSAGSRLPLEPTDRIGVEAGDVLRPEIIDVAWRREPDRSGKSAKPDRQIGITVEQAMDQAGDQ